MNAPEKQPERIPSLDALPWHVLTGPMPQTPEPIEEGEPA